MNDSEQTEVYDERLGIAERDQKAPPALAPLALAPPALAPPALAPPALAHHMPTQHEDGVSDTETLRIQTTSVLRPVLTDATGEQRLANLIYEAKKSSFSEIGAFWNAQYTKIYEALLDTQRILDTQATGKYVFTKEIYVLFLQLKLGRCLYEKDDAYYMDEDCVVRVEVKCTDKCKHSYFVTDQFYEDTKHGPCVYAFVYLSDTAMLHTVRYDPFWFDLESITWCQVWLLHSDDILHLKGIRDVFAKNANALLQMGNCHVMNGCDNPVAVGIEYALHTRHNESQQMIQNMLYRFKPEQNCVCMGNDSVSPRVVNSCEDDNVILGDIGQKPSLRVPYTYRRASKTFSAYVFDNQGAAIRLERHYTSLDEAKRARAAALANGKSGIHQKHFLLRNSMSTMPTREECERNAQFGDFWSELLMHKIRCDTKKPTYSVCVEDGVEFYMDEGAAIRVQHVQVLAVGKYLRADMSFLKHANLQKDRIVYAFMFVDTGAGAEAHADLSNVHVMYMNSRELSSIDAYNFYPSFQLNPADVPELSTNWARFPDGVNIGDASIRLDIDWGAYNKFNLKYSEGSRPHELRFECYDQTSQIERRLTPVHTIGTFDEGGLHWFALNGRVLAASSSSLMGARTFDEALKRAKDNMSMIKSKDDVQTTTSAKESLPTNLPERLPSQKDTHASKDEPVTYNERLKRWSAYFYDGAKRTTIAEQFNTKEDALTAASRARDRVLREAQTRKDEMWNAYYAQERQRAKREFDNLNGTFDADEREAILRILSLPPECMLWNLRKAPATPTQQDMTRNVTIFKKIAVPVEQQGQWQEDVHVYRDLQTIETRVLMDVQWCAEAGCYRVYRVVAKYPKNDKTKPLHYEWSCMGNSLLRACDFQPVDADLKFNIKNNWLAYNRTLYEGNNWAGAYKICTNRAPCAGGMCATHAKSAQQSRRNADRRLVQPEYFDMSRFNHWRGTVMQRLYQNNGETRAFLDLPLDIVDTLSCFDSYEVAKDIGDVYEHQPQFALLEYRSTELRYLAAEKEYHQFVQDAYIDVNLSLDIVVDLKCVSNEAYELHRNVAKELQRLQNVNRKCSLQAQNDLRGLQDERRVLFAKAGMLDLEIVKDLRDLLIVCDELAMAPREDENDFNVGEWSNVTTQLETCIVLADVQREARFAAVERMDYLLEYEWRTKEIFDRLRGIEDSKVFDAQSIDRKRRAEQEARAEKAKTAKPGMEMMSDGVWVCNASKRKQLETREQEFESLCRALGHR